MDIIKLRALQSEINAKAHLEIFSETSDTVIEFLRDELFIHSFLNQKTKSVSPTSARVLNSWMQNGLLTINSEDQGKISRFTREQVLWTLIISELRNFGYSLSNIKDIQTELFQETVPGFSLFRLAVLLSLFGREQMLVVFADGNIKIMSSEVYGQWLRIKFLPTHITIDFSSMIELVFDRGHHDYPVDEKIFVDNHRLLKLVYLIKTGDFETIKIALSQGDIRLIESPKQTPTLRDLHDLLKSSKDVKIKVLSHQKEFNF